MPSPAAPRRRRFVMLAMLVSALVASLVPAAARAQEPNQVVGLTVTQDHGFATLRWFPVPGATDYQIERTPVDGDDQPTGASAIVGLWRPNRQVTQDAPAFADAGFHPGDRFAWRVRARFGTAAQPYSDPVAATTLPQWGDAGAPGESLRTQWETTQAAQYTSDADEYAYTAALDAASDRVRVVEIARTVLDRPVNMFVIGYPQPPATAEEIAERPAALVNCNVHGNEPSSREACLIMARELAFADDPRTIEILSSFTVLLVPTINADGRAANTRGNSTGQDLNRDYSLIRQPETFGFVEMLRDYQPDAAFDGHEFGNSNAGDLPVLPPRHLNVAQSIFDESMVLVEGWMYEHGSRDGWWYCPYGCQGGGSVGLSQETILRNYLGLRSAVGSLLEARSSGGATRPNEGSTQNNRRRKTYSAIYTYHRFFDYFLERHGAVAGAIAESLAFQEANLERIVFRGSRPIPAHPAPHPGEAPPPNENPSGVIEVPPCGYELSMLQYTGPQPDGPPVADRLAAHGIEVFERSGMITTYVVPMAQSLRGLIPLLLDGAAAEEMVGGTRIACDPVGSVTPATIEAGAVEGGSATAALTIVNDAADVEQSLSWTIEEAKEDCTAPSDLDWLSVSHDFGATRPSSSTEVDVKLDAAGMVAPESRTGLLCLSTNDPDAPVIEVPVTLSALYLFAGFFSPVAAPPTFNDTTSGSSVPVKFTLGGDRGMHILAAGSPATRPVDCATREATGPAEPTSPAGKSGLQYEASTATYTYVWKTASGITGCRELRVELADGSAHLAYFLLR